MENLKDRTKTAFQWIGTETRLILSGAWENARRWKKPMLAALALACVAVTALMQYDVRLLAALRVTDSLEVSVFANWLSWMGKTEHVTLILTLFFAAYGIASKSRKMKRAALAIVLGVAVSGISANVMHVAFGRARPYTGEDGAFTGISMQSRHQGFPSAHSSEAWTVATVVSVMWPPAAIPACAYASGMGWARMQDNQHYPADVLAGMFWGIFCTLPLAVAARRMKVHGDGSGK